MEKRHLVDPSLCATQLGLNERKLISELDALSFLFQSLCERDLRIYAESFGAKLYHYQDDSGREIDAVVELDDGTWYAFEIKLGAHKIDEAAKVLLKIQSEMKRDPYGNPPSVLSVICGMTNAAYRRPEGVYVIPITSLKN